MHHQFGTPGDFRHRKIAPDSAPKALYICPQRTRPSSENYLPCGGSQAENAAWTLCCVSQDHAIHRGDGRFKFLCGEDCVADFNFRSSLPEALNSSEAVGDHVWVDLPRHNETYLARSHHGECVQNERQVLSVIDVTEHTESRSPLIRRGPAGRHLRGGGHRLNRVGGRGPRAMSVSRGLQTCWRKGHDPDALGTAGDCCSRLHHRPRIKQVAPPRWRTHHQCHDSTTARRPEQGQPG